MKRLCLLLLIFSSTLYCRDIYPSMEFRASGIVSDFTIYDGKLYVGTDRGVVDVFDIKSAKLLYQIPLDPVRNERSKIVPARILSVDSKDGVLLILSIGENGFRDLWIYKSFVLKKVVGGNRKLFAKEARFSDRGEAVVGTFGSRVARYSIEEGYEAYNIKASQSSMGDMVVVEGGKRVLFSDEAGEIFLIDAKSGRVLKRIYSKHLDKIHHLAYSKGVLISGGHDRRVGVYPKSSKPYYIRTSLPVFCVAITPDAKTGLFTSGDDQAIQLFDIKSRKMTDRLVGHTSMVNQIKFMDDKRVLSSERGPKVLLWRIP